MKDNRHKEQRGSKGKKESEREREIEKEGGEDKEKKMASIYKSLPNE